MKTLVTGATGLVGNNAVRELLDRGHEVRVLVRAGSDSRPLEGLAVERAEGDIRDASSVERAMEGVEWVVHAAAYVHIGWSALDEQRAVNVMGTRNLAQAANRGQARMVYVSSVDALGLVLPKGVADEETQRGNNTPCSYVVTKGEAEDVMRTEMQNGLDAVIVNPGFMIGPWDWKPSSGRMLLEIGTRFAPLAPTGGCSICDVRDVVAGIISALEIGASGRSYVLAGYNLSYLEIWRKFARAGGRMPAIGRLGPAMRFIAGRSGDFYGRLTGREPEINSALMAMSSLYHYYSSERARAELDYRNRPLDETIKEAWDWFRAQGYV